jgi:hypothetical protein
MSNSKILKKYKYKIVKEDKDDFKSSTILKKGIEAEFTVRDLESMEKEVRKTLKEAIAQYNLEAAKVENIERNHEFVKEFTEEQLFTLGMYVEARKNYTRFKKFADETEVKLAEYEEEMKDMYEKLGVTPTPYGGELE